MAATYEEALRTGGGRIEYVAHIHGLPWAVCTHPAIPAMIDAAMGSIYPAISLRREMFGNIHCTIGADDIYPADYVQIVPGMEPPGEQTVKLSATMGSIDAGGFKIDVLDTDYGLTLPHRPENPVHGLDCIHTIPDYRYDDTIRWSVLTHPFIKGELTFYVVSDAALHARILARVAAGLPCYLWIGNECVMATDSTDDGEELKIDCVRAVWRSREQAHYLDAYDGASYPVCDVPFGGAVGKPITIWAILVDEDCTTILDVARGRCGRVSTGIESQDGTTEIDCDGWTDWLKTPLKGDTWQSPLRGYHISRPAATIADNVHDAAGHIVLASNTGAPFTVEHLWFCDPGADLYFDTYEELCDHVRDELALLAVGAGTYNPGPISAPLQLSAGNTGLRTSDALGAWISGPFVWAFQWGRAHEGSGSWPTSFGSPASGAQWYFTSKEYLDDISLVPIYPRGEWMAAFEFVMPPVIDPLSLYYHQAWSGQGPSAYFYQWPWHHDADASAANSSGFHHLSGVTRRRWPVPYVSAHVDHALTISDEFDAEEIVADADVRVARLLQSPGTHDGIGRSAGGLSDYVVFDAVGDCTSEDDPTSPAIKINGGKSVHKGYCLFQMHPLLGSEGEEYATALSIYNVVRISPAIDPWFVFAALTGSTIAGVFAAERWHADQIPDLEWNVLTALPNPTLPTDQASVIDWKEISPWFCEIMSGEYYKLKFPDASEISLATVLEAFLLAHGVSPTWEFDAAWKMWRMKFRPFAIANATEATLFARALNESNIVRDGYKIEHTRSNLYSQIDYNGGWNGKAHLLVVHTPARSAIGATGGRSAILTINDYVTQFGDVETLQDDDIAQLEIKSHFGAGLIPRVAQPAPSVTIRTLPSTTTILGVGVVAVVDDAYIRDPHSNRPGIVGRAALLTETRSFLYGKENKTTLRFFASETRGYVPSLQIKNGDQTGTDPDVVHFGGAATDPANNVFGWPYWPLTDLAYFDCYRIIGGVPVLDISCSCDPYRVMLIERYTDTPAVHRDLQIANIDLAAGTFDLVGAGLDAAFVPGEYVLLFEGWGNANLQPCQRHWLYHADEDKLLIDSAAVETAGKGWT